jgi:hypothetical protein
MTYFGDVDVVLKLAACGFLPSLPELLGVAPEGCQFRYLGSLKSRIRRPGKKLANAAHQADLEAFCHAHSIVAEGATLNASKHCFSVAWIREKPSCLPKRSQPVEWW